MRLGVSQRAAEVGALVYLALLILALTWTTEWAGGIFDDISAGQQGYWRPIGSIDRTTPHFLRRDTGFPYVYSSVISVEPRSIPHKIESQNSNNALLVDVLLPFVLVMGCLAGMALVRRNSGAPSIAGQVGLDG